MKRLMTMTVIGATVFSLSAESRTVSISKPLDLRRLIMKKAQAPRLAFGWGPGENSTYDVQLAGLAGFRAGMVVARPGKIGSRRAIKVRVVGETVSSMASFVPFKEDVVSTIDLGRMRPLTTVSVRETRSNQRTLKTTFGRYLEYSLARAGKVGRRKRKVSLALHDPISALFYLRSIPLRAGTKGTIFLAAGTKLYRMQWRVANRAKELVGGKAVDLWKLKSYAEEIDDRGATIKNKKARFLSLWLSADAQRIPLKLEVDSDFGKATATLKSFQASKKPLSQSVRRATVAVRSK